MKPALLLLSLLAAFSTAKAELLEHNITFQLKRYDQQADTKKGETTTMAYKTIPVKNWDIIQLINKDLNKDFSKKARLLYLVYITKTSSSQAFVVRENGVDFPLTDFVFTFSQDSHFAVTDVNIAHVKQAKATAKSASHALLGPGIFSIVNGTDDPKMGLRGAIMNTSRSVLSKEFDELVLELQSYSFKGIGMHNLGDSPDVSKRVIEGTVKLSKPKVRKTPVLPD